MISKVPDPLPRRGKGVQPHGVKRAVAHGVATLAGCYPRSAPMSDWCLITDIDGTLIGQSNSTDALRRAILRERGSLAARGHRLYWVIATGRGLESTREVLADE